MSGSLQGKYLIVGLGNPGRQYEKTRHNVGFMVTDYLVQEAGGVFNHVHLHYDLATIVLNNQQVLVQKPLTYMNLSGRAVINAMRTYRIQPENVLIVYDDIHLPVGRIRIRPNGSDGGQKGLKSILNMLNTKQVKRIRVGVGLDENEEVVDYVLSPFSSEQAPLIKKSIQMASQAVHDTLQHSLSYAMNFYNGLHCQ